MPKKKSTKSSTSIFTEMLRDTANEILKDVDEAGDLMMKELRAGFDSISERMNNAAKVAQETSKSVKDKVSEIESREVLLQLMDEVEDISNVVMDGVGQQFNQLRDKLREQEAASAGTKKKTVRKKSSKKKTAKKKATKKKVAGKKRVVKKSAKKKSPVRRKKSSVKKKVVRKKSASSQA